MLQSVYPRINNQPIREAAGGGMVYCTNWIRLRDAKKHTVKPFLLFKGDLISQWIPKFYLCDESNPINPQCGKISANFYISPPHPQVYAQKWWKFRYTSWLTKKMDLNRPARCERSIIADITYIVMHIVSWPLYHNTYCIVAERIVFRKIAYRKYRELPFEYHKPDMGSVW